MLATFFNLVCQAAIVVSRVCDAPVPRLLLCCCGRRALTCSRIAARPLAGGENPPGRLLRARDFAVTLRPAGVQVASLANKEKAFAPERSFRS
jgi:hypothetical protein